MNNFLKFLKWIMVIAPIWIGDATFAAGANAHLENFLIGGVCGMASMLAFLYL